MQLSAKEMDQILEEFRPLLEQDEQLVAVDVEHDEADRPTIYLRHRNPSRSTYRQTSHTVMRAGAAALVVPVVVVQSDETVLELAGPDEKSIFDEMAAAAHLAGMAGTKVARESGSWGTVCLCGRRVRITFEGKTCEVNGPFVFTNSHVARQIGNKLISFGKTIGTVSCLYDLNNRPTFDYGQVPWTSNVAEANFFRVFDSGGSHKAIQGLQAVSANATIGKQGARTGWTTGRATGKSLTRVSGYTGLFPSWKGTYRSDAGDSGSPIIREINGQWYHVGIHFSSGPRFQSWDDAAIVATP